MSLLRGQLPLQRLCEIFDGLLEARLELNLWLPAEDGFGLGDVRLRRSDSEPAGLVRRELMGAVAPILTVLLQLALIVAHPALRHPR